MVLHPPYHLVKDLQVMSALVIGFGNVYRRDDGVGPAVVNALRRQLGRPPLAADEDGYDELGHRVDTLLVHQLTPELAELIANYELTVFVDAHMGSIDKEIHVEELPPVAKVGTVLHQLHPRALLALAGELYGCRPRGVLVSVRGYDFDFGEGLTPQTASLVPLAVEQILKLIPPEGSLDAGA